MTTEQKFNKEVSKWIGKGYKIIDKNDYNHTAILQKQNKINHGLHIVLSLFTAGFWLIIYFFILLGAKKNGETITISMQNEENSNKPINPSGLFKS